MADRQKRTGVPGLSASAATKSTSQDEPAFDLWLQRGLHKLYDDVAKEPIPEELLRLIREDQKK